MNMCTQWKPCEDIRFFKSISELSREICICKLMLNKILKERVILEENVANTRLHDGPVVKWPDVSNDKFKKFIPHLGPTIFNKLPPEIRNIQDVSEFKCKIKTHYKKQL